MSGRKDYTYVFDVMRMAAQIAETHVRRAARSRQTQTRLEAAKVDAQRRAEELGRRQRESNLTLMQQAAEASRHSLLATAQQATEVSGPAAVPQAEQVETQTSVEAQRRAEGELQQATMRRLEAEAAVAAAVELQAEIEKQMQAILQWQQSFQESEDVQNFAVDRLASWNERVQQSEDAISNSDPSVEMLSNLQRTAAAAEALEAHAGEVSDQFFARNAVVTDIIDSLKEIGFFVQDPEFADSSHPEGAVIIRANRGNENLTTSVSLDQKVESDWQGVHGEYCTGGFFEYVKAMDDRGIKITPDDPNLKPKLLQKGAKDLPGNRQRAAGDER